MQRRAEVVLGPVAAVAICGADPSHGVCPGPVTIAGVVRDASGAVLPGVTVEAASPVLIEKVRSATSAMAPVSTASPNCPPAPTR